MIHRPIVLVPSCVRQIGAHVSHTTQYKYLEALVEGAHCMPLILPSLGEHADLEAALAVCDGILLSGSRSNVHPVHYEQELDNPAAPHDPARDATTLPLIRTAVARGIPLLAVCRGMQEMNVALGGSLHQSVHQVPGMADHREDNDKTLELQYGPAHAVDVTAGGVLARILGNPHDISVNSLHGQGVDRLAPGLRVEAIADDGLIEAFSLEDDAHFGLALQWHPEWRLRENWDSLRIFMAFGAACRSYQIRAKGES